MRIRPCIDIHNGKVKQIVGSTLRDGAGQQEGTASENFVADRSAAFYSSVYKSLGLRGGHIILLNSVKDKEAYIADLEQAYGALSAFPDGMQIGGGITPETAPSFLSAGASHVIVTSYVFRDGKLDEAALSNMVSAVGRDRLVLDLSCRRKEDGTYAVVTDRWQKFTDYTVNEENLDRLSQCCDEFLIHAADVEGKRAGVEKSLVTLLGAWQKRSGFPVTYAGGVHSLEDLDLIGSFSGDAMDVTVGSALSLFGGDLDLNDLVKKAKRREHTGS